ncbi:MAG: HD domain-containing phosphohydrolase [Comamonadaceae bacterium]
MLNSSDDSQHGATQPALAALAVAAFAMSILAGTRGGHHIVRVQHYVRILARHLQTLPQFAAVLTEPYIDVLIHVAPLHDLGSIGIPDWILLKPGNLNPVEYAIIKTHTTQARDVIEQAEKNFGYQGDSIKTLKEIVYCHHEKWDGSGYPQGLSGVQIPLAGRLLAIVDAYDTITSDHVYKRRLPHEQAVGEIFHGRGSIFDPDMVDAFIEIQDEFRPIAQRYADTSLDIQRKMDYMAKAIAEEAEQPVI